MRSWASWVLQKLVTVLKINACTGEEKEASLGRERS